MLVLEIEDGNEDRAEACAASEGGRRGFGVMGDRRSWASWKLNEKRTQKNYRT